jgi:hypothetical protein
MIMGGAAALLMLLLGGGDGSEPAAPEDRYAQVTIRQQIIVRMPQVTRPGVPASAITDWRESRGPRCVNASEIRGATFLSRNSVDLVMRDNSRVRARLESSCPALDYYYGFYVAATVDGRICADRDAIRSRMGGECGIDQFRSLRAIKD